METPAHRLSFNLSGDTDELKLKIRGSVRTFGSLTVRQLAGLGVAVAGLTSVVCTLALPGAAPEHVLSRLDPNVASPSVAHVLVLLAGLALLVLAPNILRGTRLAVPLAIVALGLISLLDGVAPVAVGAGALAVGLAVVLTFGWREFPLGARNRAHPALLLGAGAAWTLTYLAILADPLMAERGKTIRQALGHVLYAPSRLSDAWVLLVEVLIACGAATSLLALRSLVRPASLRAAHSDREYRNARALVERHGEDSLAPFILRSDKSFHFHGDGVLAYRVIGETAVISGDPVAPASEAGEVLRSFREHARKQGWGIALWGASSRHLHAYRQLGLHALQAGEEAFVAPSAFTLDGRPVRKLRQSVHRVRRRGWSLATVEGREVNESLACEIEALDDAWRKTKRRLLGFAMGTGPCEADTHPDDLYFLARSPDGELRAAMRFVAHGGKLSLDTMRRLEDTPNGLNEALVCRALDVARQRGIPEISLNYAGLAHLARDRASHGKRPKALNRLVLRALGRRFQMDRLVRFNEKFSPEWRPRFLVYESRLGLPRTVLRVLEVEGYFPQRRPSVSRSLGLARLLPRGLRADAAR